MFSAGLHDALTHVPFTFTLQLLQPSYRFLSFGLQVAVITNQHLASTAGGTIGQ